jgi:hypothetical protein
MRSLQNRSEPDLPQDPSREGFQAFINTYHEPSLQTARTDEVWVNDKTREVRTKKKDSNFRLCPPPTNDDCPFPQVDNELDVFEVLCARGYALHKHLAIPHACYGFNQYYGPNIHGGPLFWTQQNLIFGTAEKDAIKSFKYSLNATTDYVQEVAKSVVIAPDGMPGGALSFSSDGSDAGIIWGSFPKQDNTFFLQRGIIAAFNALPIEYEGRILPALTKIWSDEQSPVDFTKFCPPTVAGGKVFRVVFTPSSPLPRTPGEDHGKLLIYGPCSKAIPCIQPRSFCDRLKSLFHAFGN